MAFKSVCVKTGVWMRANKLPSILWMTFFIALIPIIYLLESHFSECPNKKYQVGYNPKLEDCYCDRILSSSHLYNLITKDNVFDFAGQGLSEKYITLGMGSEKMNEYGFQPIYNKKRRRAASTGGYTIYYSSATAYVFSLPLEIWVDYMTSSKIVDMNVNIDTLLWHVGYFVDESDSNTTAPPPRELNEGTTIPDPFDYYVTNSKTFCPNIDSHGEDDKISDCSTWHYSYCFSSQIAAGGVVERYHGGFLGASRSGGGELCTTEAMKEEWDRMYAESFRIRDFVVDEMRRIFSTEQVAYCTPSYCFQSDCFGLELCKVIFLVVSASSVAFTLSQIIYFFVEKHYFPLIADTPDMTIKTNHADSRVVELRTLNTLEV